MSRHCWVIEVPTTRGGWMVVKGVRTRSMARVWRKLHTTLWCCKTRIVKYTPEVEDE